MPQNRARDQRHNMVVLGHFVSCTFARDNVEIYNKVDNPAEKYVIAF